jgi:hypothetical protein
MSGISFTDAGRRTHFNIIRNLGGRMPEVVTEQPVQNRVKKPSSIKTPRINQKQDTDLLEIVRDTTFITNLQLVQICKRRGIAICRSTFNWRFGRLLKAKLVEKLSTDVFPFKGPVYSISREGLAVLEHYGKGIVSIGSESEHLASPKQAHHFLTLNEIMFQLDRCFSIRTFMCDRVLRSYNMTLAAPLAKDYDAFVTIDRSSLNKPPLSIAIEYEASLKSSERYQEISSALDQERQVRLVVYFCGSAGMTNVLTAKVNSRACHVCFGSYTDFMRDGSQMKMLVRQKQEARTVTFQKLIEML